MGCAGVWKERYMLLSDRGVRNIDAYNKKIIKQKKATSVGGDEGLASRSHIS
jgi:DNA segregation ATPase FtsK/SpoIIIE-like protein